MQVLGTRLTREEHELLGADALRVDIDDDLEPDLVELREAEVGHLDRAAFVRRQHDSGLGKRCRRSLSRCTELLSREHVRAPALLRAS